jgi:hypothetical protein
MLQHNGGKEMVHMYGEGYKVGMTMRVGKKVRFKGKDLQVPPIVLSIKALTAEA